MDNIIHFLKNDFHHKMASIPEDRSPLWGKMTVRHMTEHMSREGFQVASGKITVPQHTPDEHIPAMQAFLRSEKQFRENTANALMGEEPPALVFTSQQEALEDLRREIDYFFSVYESQPDKVLLNPFFGMLDYELWLRLLHKHAIHHLKQFGVQA